MRLAKYLLILLTGVMLMAAAQRGSRRGESPRYTARNCSSVMSPGLKGTLLINLSA